MPKYSAGLLPYRTGLATTLEVLIVHPGGPFWSKKDDGAWSIPKGEYELGEDPLSVAEREFTEELGKDAPLGERLELGEVRQPSGKRIIAWAVLADIDVSDIKSNSFEIEWPPKSATMQSFPEVDRAMWFSIKRARTKLLKGQVPFLDRLAERLHATSSVRFSEGDGENK